MESLPNEILLHVLLRTPLRDLLGKWVVCHQWHRVLGDKKLRWVCTQCKGLHHSQLPSSEARWFDQRICKQCEYALNIL